MEVNPTGWPQLRSPEVAEMSNKIITEAKHDD